MNRIPLARFHNWLSSRTKMARRGQLPLSVITHCHEAIATLLPLGFGQYKKMRRPKRKVIETAEPTQISIPQELKDEMPDLFENSENQ